jgi:alpha-glucuronidase
MARTFAALALCALAPLLRADDGYRLWLRYDRIADEPLRQAYAAALPQVVLLTPRGTDSPTLQAARDELRSGLGGLLGSAPAFALAADPGAPPAAAGAEGYALRRAPWQGRPALVIEARSDVGVLYGAFGLLRALAIARPADRLDEISAPKIQRRILDHWDNLDGSQEHGYAGYSIWNWFELPDYADPRYRDYARADASVGINGVVLNNVNADPLVLTDVYLDKVAALAAIFRPYGIRVYLSPRFSAPIELGHLPTADPLDPGVIAWWRAEIERIYRRVPDFGGFLVKADSEGQPGPQDYGRTHADGANLLADLLAPHGGIVMWRAFVYGQDNREDRAKQAYDEFRPLDGEFRDNVAIQIKNGPLDFQPREPFHPLFGAMPHTSLGLEVQITQEYLGGSIHLAYLGTLWEEVLRSDTLTAGPGSTVARIVDGRRGGNRLSVMAGVANIGTDRNWCGHPLASANWYAFGRLAWDDDLGAAAIADEWTRQNFGEDPATVGTIDRLLLASREAVVDYMTPLGLNLIMAHDHHYGPGPWDEQGRRRDWWAPSYHRAAPDGIGFDRTLAGSDALGQYASAIARRWGDLATCPDDLLLWFHHVAWDYRMRSGRTLWDELCLHYQSGVDQVRGFQRAWESLRGRMDDERFEHARILLAAQERDARFWRDSCLLYFQTFSHRPLPPGVEPADHPLAYYESIRLR